MNHLGSHLLVGKANWHQEEKMQGERQTATTNVETTQSQPQQQPQAANPPAQGGQPGSAPASSGSCPSTDAGASDSASGCFDGWARSDGGRAPAC